MNPTNRQSFDFIPEITEQRPGVVADNVNVQYRISPYKWKPECVIVFNQVGLSYLVPVDCCPVVLPEEAYQNAINEQNRKTNGRGTKIDERTEEAHQIEVNEEFRGMQETNQNDEILTH
eukprot:507068_1